MPKNKNKAEKRDLEFAVQLQESEEFANKLMEIYRFIRFGGVLSGDIISGLANNHIERTYSETQLLADVQAFMGIAKRLRKEAERLAVKRGESKT
jgi:hypothetical protein